MEQERTRTEYVGHPGCMLGSVAAVCLSIKTWGFTWWVLLHFFFGWIYVIYWVVFLSGWIGGRG